LGTCSLGFSVLVREYNLTSNGPFGTCAGPTCIPPRSGPFGLGRQVVLFTQMTGGVPLSTVDAAALNGVQWNLIAPTDGVTAPCEASFTITDVTFVKDTVAPQIHYTFDRGTSGWTFSDFDSSSITNLAVRPPDGGTP